MIQIRFVRYMLPLIFVFHLPVLSSAEAPPECEVGGCPLHDVMYEKAPQKEVDRLLEEGYNVNTIKKSTGYAPLHEAVQKNLPDVVESLIKKGANISQETGPKFGTTPLILAIILGFTNLFPYFKEIMNEPNSRNNLPLHYATVNPKTICELIKLGADPDLVTTHPKTPRQIMALPHNKDALEALETCINSLRN